MRGSLAAPLQDDARLLWIVDIYGVPIAGSLIAIGTLGYRIGRRRLLILGVRAAERPAAMTSSAPSCRSSSRVIYGVKHIAEQGLTGSL